MAISFTRPDPASPASVSSAQFPTARRGYDQDEVRDFLRMVAAEQARLQERERFLERELRAAQQANSTAVVFDDETATKMLGEEAARVLQTAREAAAQIRTRAEEGSARLLREATDEAQRIREEAEIEAARRRQDASSDAEAELQMAKQQGRDMVNEARSYRERVLSELARRRELARQQIEQLIHGRDRLLQAFERSRIAAVEVMAELTPLGEPTEYVNLQPTTGPVPMMVPMARPAPTPVPAASEDLPRDDRPSDDRPTEEIPQLPAPQLVVADFDDFVDDSDDTAATEPAAAVDDEAVDEAVDEPIDGADDEPVIELHLVQETTDDDAADDSADDTVVALPPPLPVDDTLDVDDDRQPAPVVALFAEEDDSAEVAPAVVTAPTPSVDDLFAKLRAARSESIVADVLAAAPHGPVDVAADGVAVQDSDAPAATEAPSSAVDESIVPLIVSAARKLKRVLADEQNEVLDSLRRKDPVRAIDTLLPWEAEQAARYARAVESDLAAAALAGSDGDENGRNPAIVRPALDAITNEIVAPLRERLTRCIDKAGGDNAELANQVRSLYREWKTHRIDEHVEDIVRFAFDRGALTVSSR